MTVMVNYIYCEKCKGYKTEPVDKIEDLTPKPYGDSPTSGIVLCDCSIREALANVPLGWACPRCHMVWALNKCGDGCPSCPPIDPSGFPMSRKTIPVYNSNKEDEADAMHNEILGGGHK